MRKKKTSDERGQIISPECLWAKGILVIPCLSVTSYQLNLSHTQRRCKLEEKLHLYVCVIDHFLYCAFQHPAKKICFQPVCCNLMCKKASSNLISHGDYPFLWTGLL